MLNVPRHTQRMLFSTFCCAHLNCFNSNAYSSRLFLVANKFNSIFQKFSKSQQLLNFITFNDVFLPCLVLIQVLSRWLFTCSLDLKADRRTRLELQILILETKSSTIITVKFLFLESAMPHCSANSQISSCLLEQ